MNVGFVEQQTLLDEYVIKVLQIVVIFLSG
jgi:hypothetical protein